MRSRWSSARSVESLPPGTVNPELKSGQRDLNPRPLHPQYTERMADGQARGRREFPGQRRGVVPVGRRGMGRGLTSVELAADQAAEGYAPLVEAEPAEDGGVIVARLAIAVAVEEVSGRV